MIRSGGDAVRIGRCLRCRVAATVGCGYKPMLAKVRSTAAKVAAVMISMVNSRDRARLAVPDEVLGAGVCALLSQHLAIQRRKRDASPSVGCTAWKRRGITCILSV